MRVWCRCVKITQGLITGGPRWGIFERRSASFFFFIQPLEGNTGEQVCPSSHRLLFCFNRGLINLTSNARQTSFCFATWMMWWRPIHDGSPSTPLHYLRTMAMRHCFDDGDQTGSIFQTKASLKSLNSRGWFSSLSLSFFHPSKVLVFFSFAECAPVSPAKPSLAPVHIHMWERPGPTTNLPLFAN